MGTVALPEAMGNGMHVMRADGFKEHDHRPWDTLVLEAGCPAGPLLPLGLLAPYPFDRRRHRPILAPPLMQRLAGGVQGLGGLLGRHLVPPQRTALTGLTIGCPPALTVDQGQHGVAPPRRIALGLRGNALELQGDGW
jgi:hypothetical protein